MNKKKLEVSYKRYKKNFKSRIESGMPEEEYNEVKDEILKIIKTNDVNKDHILLIDLDTIRQYYILKWKRNVLTEEKQEKEDIKQMQILTFYECIVQDLYKIRYSNMRLQYNFRDVIISLIHFNLFGWTREENILFKFIIENMGSNILKINDENTHIWYLLELYLQYTGKNILGKDTKINLVLKKELSERELENSFIPDTLNVYDNTLEKWKTKDLQEITEIIEQMIEYHSEKAENTGDLGEFTDYIYGFYPIEILFLIHVRKKMGLPVPENFDDFLMNNPEAKMEFNDKELYPEEDGFVGEIDKFYRKNYPEYIPNEYGELFK